VKYLLDGVRKYGTHWTTILRHYPFNKQHTAADLKEKYKRITKKASQTSLVPSTARGHQCRGLKPHPFSMDEDLRLVHGVKMFRSDWRMILSTYSYHTRTAKQLRHRFRVLEAHHQGQGQWCI